MKGDDKQLYLYNYSYTRKAMINNYIYLIIFTQVKVMKGDGKQLYLYNYFYTRKAMINNFKTERENIKCYYTWSVIRQLQGV